VDTVDALRAVEWASRSVVQNPAVGMTLVALVVLLVLLADGLGGLVFRSLS
jgi:hypothetical protein